MEDRNEIKDQYLELSLKYEARASGEKRLLLILSLLRLIVFIGGLILTVAGFLQGSAQGLAALLGTAAIFLVLLVLYSKHNEKLSFFTNISRINRDELKALDGDLSSFEDGKEWIDAGHDFSNDIDLFGGDSLFRFLNRTVTGYGKNILAGWLAYPEELAPSLEERQQSISELAGMLHWRQEFLAHGSERRLAEDDVKSLMGWLNEHFSVFRTAAFNIAIWLFPSLSVILLILALSGLMHYSFFVFFFLVNLLITAFFLRVTNRIHNAVSKKYAFLSSLGRLMKMFEGREFKAGKLVEIKESLTLNDTSAVHRIKRLSRIIQSFDSRLNMMVGFVLNGLLLWDLHCIRILERWKNESSGLLPGWLMKIGEADAYISMANYAFNNPGFCYPEKSGGDIIIKAVRMGHPLIPGDVRVCNDLAVEKRGMIGIITGANMAGKSTFLRTVAVNFVIGMTGAPVCCEKMIFSPVKLFTSMRTIDSLSQNESYFYAELKRLKALKIRIEKGEQILFVLDEILKGTNSADKSTGSRLFIKKMIEFGGTGLIATHDTSLGEMEKEYPGVIFNKCFEIDIDGENISFDYILREGITTKMNAALLMKQMGIAD